MGYRELYEDYQALLLAIKAGTAVGVAAAYSSVQEWRAERRRVVGLESETSTGAFVMRGSGLTEEEIQSGEEYRSLTNDDSRDDRIAYQFEGNPGLENERFTLRSISRDIAALDATLAKVRGDTIDAAITSNAGRWFVKEINTNRLPAFQQVSTAEDNPNRVNNFAKRNYTAEQTSDLRLVAKNSLTFYSIFNGMVPTNSNIDGYNTNRWTVTVGDRRFEGGAPFPSEIYTLANTSLDTPPSSELNDFVKSQLNAVLSSEEYGRSITSNYGRLQSAANTVSNFFRDNVDYDFSKEIESSLFQKATQNYLWLFYANTIREKYSITQFESNSPIGTTVETANLLLGSSTLSFEGTDGYIQKFTDIIYRSRIYEAIKEYDQELAQRIIEEPGLDLLNENGFYNDPAAAERRIREIILEEQGDVDAFDDAAVKRLAEQCFLIDFLPEFAQLNQQRAMPYQTFVPVQGKTDTIVNKMMYNRGLGIMDTLKPAEIASLVPKIRIFKILYDDAGTGEFREPVEVEVPFFSHVQESEISSMMNSSRERGQGAGIVSFDWVLDGQNPFAARRNISAKLKLFFQSMETFIGEVPGGLPVLGEGRTDRKPFRYIDLVNIAVATRTPDNLWNPDYYKLKIEVGWTASDMDVFVGNVEEKKRAIEESKMVLFLGAIDHDININDQGNVELDISYIAYQEASYIDAESDVLAGPERRALRKKLREAVNELRREDPCNTFEINALQEEYRSFVQRQNEDAWKRILQDLTDNNQVFYMPVPMSTLERLYFSAAEAQGGTSVRGLLAAEIFNTQESNFTGQDVLNRGNTPTNDATSAILAAQRQGSIIDDASVRKFLQDLSYDSGDGDTVNIQYFYFGDLIETALRHISSTEAISYGDQERITTIVGKKDKNLKILMGPVTFEGVANGEPAPFYNINLADIPISVNYFIEWFMSTIISKNRTQYPILLFIRDTLTQIVQTAVGRQCRGLENIERQNLQLRTNFITAGAVDGSCDPVESLRNILESDPSSVGRDGTSSQGFGLDVSGCPGDGTNFTRVDVDEAFKKLLSTDGGSKSLLTTPADGDTAYNYMLVYSIDTPTLEQQVGNYDQDAERGVYHFGIGRDAGLLKSIKFSKMDLPGLREARYEKEFLEEAAGLAVLANRYSVTITTIGNTLFWPGTKIYIDPSGLGQIGSPTVAGDPARVLGIGGYHRVYAVNSYIESGKYETVIKALWESAGDEESVTTGTAGQTAGYCDRESNSINVLARSGG
jgi:hypothetical protein